MFAKLAGKAGHRSIPPPIPTLDPHQYEKLREPDNIRLLRIAPGTGTQDIQSFLTEISLAENPHYEALSYTWGSPGVGKRISCNGRAIHISVNLFEALRHIRKTDIEVVFWIDQLCINQADLVERSSQVALMGGIYSQASRVIVWLGSEDSNSKTGIVLARRILEVVGDRVHYHLMPEHLEELSLPPYKDKSWRALGLFLQRPWFSRMWILQEVVMAQEAIFVCGNEKISMVDFEKLVDRLMNLTSYKSFAGNYSSNSNGIWCLGVVQQLRKMRNSSTRTLSLDLLGIGMASQATDPRDKLYALLGLGKLGVEADYTKSVDQVYTSFAISYISQILPSTLTRKSSKYITDQIYSQYVAKLLVWVHSTDSTLNMPSWVPDWSHFPATSFIGATSQVTIIASASIPDTPENAEKYRLAEITLLPNSNNALRLSGKVCDTISHIGRRCIDLRRTDMPPRTLYNNFADWYAETSVLVSHISSSPSQFYPSGIPWQEAYIRTLTMEHVGLGDRSKADLYTVEHLRLSHARLRQWNRASAIEKFLAGGEKNEAAFWHDALKICGRCFFLTAKGYMGLAPMGTQTGDRIVTLLAINNPFVIREVEGDVGGGRGWKLIGSCYVQGMMDGEAVLSDFVPWELITLV